MRYHKKEALHITIAIILMSIVLSLFNIQSIMTSEGLWNYITYLLYSIIIIIIWVAGKKIAGAYFGVNTDHRILGLKRYWYWKKTYLKKPFPTGLIIPLLFSLLSQGSIKIFTFLQTNVTPHIKRTVKKRGKKTYSELDEFDISLTFMWSIISLLILSLITNQLGYIELTK